ncbi:MAG: MATE family efflux transporter [Alphaproteobacteria bacterium]
MPATQTSAALPARDPNRLAGHIVPTLKLAVPVVATRAGLLLMLALDTAMLGHHDTGELAGFAAASAVQIVMILIAVGLLQGTAILTAQAAGAGQRHACGTYFRASLVLALVVGAALGLLCLAGGWFLGVLGQEPAVAAIGGRAFAMFAWSYPAFGLWLAIAMFLEGLSRPVPGMVITFLGLAANGLLDWLFIFGGLGLPPMGAEGAAIATSIVRHLMLFALAGYVLTLRDRKALGLLDWRDTPLSVVRKLCRLGLPLALSRGLETGAFSALTLIAGLIGPAALAGYQITYNLIGLVFMAAVGTGTATMIRVGNAVGRRDALGARRAGWAGVLVVSAVTGAATVVFFSAPAALASLYTDEPALRVIVTTLIFVGGFTLVLDGAQMVLQGALRGLADIWTTMMIQFSAWWVVCVPLGYGLALALGLGPSGLIWAILAGSIVAAGVSALRFRVLTARGIAPA